jgi:hypothetical protein
MSESAQDRNVTDMEDEPSNDEPAKDEPAMDEPAMDEPSEDKPSEDEPSKDEPSEDEPSKDEPSKDEPSAGMRSDRVSDAHNPDNRESSVQTEREAVAESTPAGREPTRSSTAADDPAMRQPVDSDGWRELSDVEQRFHELEAEFIQEPQAAVKKAEILIEEAVERITRQLHDEVARMHGKAEGSSDTEQLRVAMLSYRTLIESIGGHRAA